jgi:chemotaxis protein CheZ
MQTAIVITEAPHCAARAGAEAPLTPHDIFVRIGTLTRSLHDTLRQLGYDKDVEAAVGALPDARARLDYIATLTGKAAERVLDAAERAKTAQDNLRADALVLQQEWTAVLDQDADARSLFELGRKTQRYLAGVQLRHEKVDCELSEIVLAQDFHDLTGQVIQRVTRLARSLEEQLVKLLLDASPPMQRKEVLENALAGPVINGAGRDDVVTDQGQVDDLLESLGF